MFFLSNGETDSTKAKGGNRDVIEQYDTHKGDIRKIRHSGPGWSGVWTDLRVASSRRSVSKAQTERLEEANQRVD